MKKLFALLLCVVIFASVFTVSVSAESAHEGAFTKESLVLLLTKKNSFLEMILQKFVNKDANEEITAPSKPENEADSSISDYEKKVVTLVNAERAKYGLSALKISLELTKGARLKSLDMHDHRYFSHTSATYGTPFAMMKSLGITYRTAGENIARGYSTAEAVVKAWMNSKSHRANILNASYTEIGV
jgi:uncharacterized YkwD family protein